MIRWDYAWCRRLAQLIEQAHPNPVQQLMSEYTVSLKKVQAYLRVAAAAIKSMESNDKGDK